MSCTNPPPARITPTNYARPTKQPPWCRETSSRPSFRVLEREGSARSLLRPAWSTFLVNWITIRDVISDILYSSWEDTGWSMASKDFVPVDINEEGEKCINLFWMDVSSFRFLFQWNSCLLSKWKMSDTNVIILLLGRNIWLFYKEINMFKYNNIYYYAFFLLILNG